MMYNNFSFTFQLPNHFIAIYLPKKDTSEEMLTQAIALLILKTEYF